MCVCASSGSSPPISFWSRSNHGTMPLSSITRLRLRSLEQEVRRLAVLLDERERADHRYEQTLRVHVTGLDVHGLNLAREHVLHLLPVLVEVGAVHDGRPYRLLELRLGVAEEVRESLVELLEAAVERDSRPRLLDVVEAGERVARRPLLLLLREQR